MLSTLAKYGDYLPNGFITHLLEVRLTMLPPIAKRAASYYPEIIIDYLDKARDLKEDARAFAEYDWNLQILMARNSQNPVFSLILNDFTGIFSAMALRYFSQKPARQASRTFYQELGETIKAQKGIVEKVVQKAMEQSITIWQDIKSKN